MSEIETPTAPAADTRPLTDVCFDHFPLHPLLLEGLAQANFVRLTPIQALTLPLTLAGKDIAGQAQTGTGKTLAFLVTIINRLLSTPAQADRRAQDPRAVVLAPTRELAIQIEKDLAQISRQSGLRYALIYGGVDYDKQRELLRAGTDVVIATPGRLIDYVKQHVVNLASTEVVVMDEADRMFDLGFIKDIRFLLRKMPAREQRQSLLFSATLSHRVLELAYEHMNEPEKLTAETESITAERVRQQLYFPASEEKIPLLIGLLSRMDAHRTMVFVNTKAWVERVARALERAHFTVAVLSGDVPQPKREKLLTKFKKGELEILVATDVAARGLHIPDVSHVFNFDLPFDAEDYVHRIGRTARLGAEGDAISFACDLYAMSLPEIEKYIEQKIPVARVEAELLQPVARKPRAAPPEGEAAESISEILHGAEANALRDRQRDRAARDGSGPGRGRGAGASRGRTGGPRPERTREGAGGGARAHDARPASPQRPEHAETRPPRPPRAEGNEGRPRPPRAEGNEGRPARPPRPEGTEGRPAQSPRPEDAEAPRKRRRRGGRGRRRAEEGTGTREQAATAPGERASSASPKAQADGGAARTESGKRPLMARLGQGIKSLVNRLPLPGRRR